jgi:hypothetical protein
MSNMESVNNAELSEPKNDMSVIHTASVTSLSEPAAAEGKEKCKDTATEDERDKDRKREKKVCS